MRACFNSIRLILSCDGDRIVTNGIGGPDFYRIDLVIVHIVQIKYGETLGRSRAQQCAAGWAKFAGIWLRVCRGRNICKATLTLFHAGDSQTIAIASEAKDIVIHRLNAGKLTWHWPTFIDCQFKQIAGA